MSRRRAPKAVAGSSLVAVALAALTVAVGGVGLRDLAAGLDWVSGTVWTSDAVAALDGMRPVGWMVPAAVASSLVGVWLILVAIKPRPRTHLGTPSRAQDVWFSRGALAAMAKDAADRQPGVASSTVRIGRTVNVGLRVTAADLQGVARAAEESVRSSLEGTTTKRVKATGRKVGQ